VIEGMSLERMPEDKGRRSRRDSIDGLCSTVQEERDSEVRVAGKKTFSLSFSDLLN